MGEGEGEETQLNLTRDGIWIGEGEGEKTQLNSMGIWVGEGEGEIRIQKTAHLEMIRTNSTRCDAMSWLVGWMDGSDVRGCDRRCSPLFVDVRRLFLFYSLYCCPNGLFRWFLMD